MKKLALLLFLISCISAKNGHIIFLNGPSSAGKSSISKEMIKLDPTYKIVSIDDVTVESLRNFFRKKAPEEEKKLFELIDDGILLGFFSFLSDKRRNKKLENLIEDPGELQSAKVAAKRLKKVFKAHLFKVFAKVCLKNAKALMIERARNLASSGENVIVDHVVIDRSHLKSLCNAFKDIPVLFVGVTAPQKVLRTREKKRDHRDRGVAHLVYKLVHAHNTYDIKLDTSTLTPKEGAKIVHEANLSFDYNDGVFSDELRKKLSKSSMKLKYGWYTFRTNTRMGFRVLMRKF